MSKKNSQKKQESLSRKLWYLLLALLVGTTMWFLVTTNFQKELETPPILGNCSAENYIYVIYSPTCPHCKHLLETIKQLNTSCVKFVLKNIYNMSKEDWWVFMDYNISVPGVPLVFAVTRDGKVLRMLGYPTKSQDVDGYFYGVDREKLICTLYNGTPIFENGTYKFCYIRDDRFGDHYLGNYYALLYIIKVCQDFGCIDIYENITQSTKVTEIVVK